MGCDLCVFSPSNQNRTRPPCNSCDGTNRGYCLASQTPQGYHPVISNLADEARARQLIAHAASNGTTLTLLCWSSERSAFLPISL